MCGTSRRRLGKEVKRDRRRRIDEAMFVQVITYQKKSSKRNGKQI
jgi:hypothetical protein